MKYAGLTKELHERLTDELNALKAKHPRQFGAYVRSVKNLDIQQSRRYCQKIDNVAKNRMRLSPNVAEDMRGIISDDLLNDLKEYLAENYSGQLRTRKEVDATRAGLSEELFQRYRKEIDEFRTNYPYGATTKIMEIKSCTKREALTIQSMYSCLYREQVILTPRKVIQLEGLLSRDLYSDIARYVFGRYEWPESLDDEVDRITLEYRKKDRVGRDKASVKRYLYKALAMGL